MTVAMAFLIGLAVLVLSVAVGTGLFVWVVRPTIDDTADAVAVVVAGVVTAFLLAFLSFLCIAIGAEILSALGVQ